MLRQGTYTNTITFLIELKGPRDTLFGVAGLNHYITLMLARERAHP